MPLYLLEKLRKLETRLNNIILIFEVDAGYVTAVRQRAKRLTSFTNDSSKCLKGFYYFRLLKSTELSQREMPGLMW